MKKIHKTFKKLRDFAGRCVPKQTNDIHPNIQETFNELRDFVASDEDEYGNRWAIEAKDVNWDGMINRIENLDPIIAQIAVEYRDDDDYRKRNLMMWALKVKGGPPSKLVESILNVSSEVLKQKDDFSDQNCLHYGVVNGSPVETIKLLMNENPKALMEKDEWDQTPLHAGIYFNNSISREMIQLCVERNPELTEICGVRSQTPLQLAIEKKRSDKIVLFLLETSKKNDGNNILHSAIKHEASMHILQRILVANPELALEKNDEGDSSLHMAIKNNSNQLLEIVRITVDSCPMAALLLQDNDGRTPLSSAIEKKLSNEIIDYLSLETLSDEDLSEFASQKDNDGNTRLHLAMQYGASVRVIQCMLAANPKLAEGKNDN